MLICNGMVFGPGAEFVRGCVRINGDIFDFEIEEEDMEIIDSLNQNLHVSHVPEDLRDVPF